MSVMYIRNEQTGEFEPVPSLVGPQGPPGTNGDGAGTVTSVNKVAPDTTGNITLTAANVGARPADWTPTASDVGALPSDGKAVDADKLNGKSADEYLQKYQVVNNLTTTEEGFVADARALKYLVDTYLTPKYIRPIAVEAYMPSTGVLALYQIGNTLKAKGHFTITAEVPAWTKFIDAPNDLSLWTNGVVINSSTGSVYTISMNGEGVVNNGLAIPVGNYYMIL